MQAVAGLSAGGGTPTAHAYAEAAAYMLGKSTHSGVTKYAQYNGNWYQCDSASEENVCSRNNDSTYMCK
jgi:type IV pilus assembly protein PilY1